MSPSPRMCLSKRYCTMPGSWAHILWKLVSWWRIWFHGHMGPSEITKWGSFGSGTSLCNFHNDQVTISFKCNAFNPLPFNPLPLKATAFNPLPFARGCLLHVLKEDWPPTRLLVPLVSQHVSSLNRTWEENIWQNSPKPLIPIRVVRHRQWPGGTKVQAGLRLREVFSVGGSSRLLWGPGRWLRRGGLGDLEGLAMVQPKNSWGRNLHPLSIWPTLFILIDVAQFMFPPISMRMPITLPHTMTVSYHFWVLPIW